MGKKKQKIEQNLTPPPPPPTPPKGVLGMLTGKVGKVAGALLLVSGMLTQFDAIVGAVKNVWNLKMWNMAATASPAECFTGNLHIHPVAVPVVGWPQHMKFRLTGRNACAQKLEVHVAYKAPTGMLRLESPFSKPEQSSCNVQDIDCWESRSINGNASIDWLLTPPNLRRVGPLADPVKISINWVVYNTETRKQIHAGTTDVTVRDGN